MSTVTRTNKATEAVPLDASAVRREFPALDQVVHGNPLVYLDSAATTQKPRCVIEAVRHYYERDNANVHRGVHTLSQRATEAYESARDRVRRQLNAGDVREIIFTRGTTESINLVAQAYGRPRLREGDEILISHMEHHSNIVPWQLLGEQTGAAVKVMPINDAGEIDIDEAAKLMNERTRIVAVVHVSNSLGTINPVRRIIEMAKQVGAVTVIDGAQAMPHLKVDVRDLGCDFYAISAHKMYGPTGIGALFGRRELLEAMPPYQGGGEMIKSVTFEKTTWNDLPHKFEAGTPNISGAVGFGAAIDFLARVELDAIGRHEGELLAYGTARLQEVEGLRLYGTAAQKAAVLSFTLAGVHPHDIGTILDHEGLAIRTGHHCTQPLMDRFGIAATARASLGVYNTHEDIDRLVSGLQKVKGIFG